MKYIARVANKANLSEKTKRQAAEIMNNVTKREIICWKRSNGACGICYFIYPVLNTGENRTQSSISKAAGVTEVTLRSRYKDLVNQLQLN